MESRSPSLSFKLHRHIIPHLDSSPRIFASVTLVSLLKPPSKKIFDPHNLGFHPKTEIPIQNPDTSVHKMEISSTSSSLVHQDSRFRQHLSLYFTVMPCQKGPLPYQSCRPSSPEKIPLCGCPGFLLPTP